MSVRCFSKESVADFIEDSSKTLSLEELIRTFLLHFSTHFPHALVYQYWPTVCAAVKNKDDSKLTVLMRKTKDYSLPSDCQGFTSFNAFLGGDVIDKMSTSGLEEMKETVLMSYVAKRAQVVGGMSVTKTIKNYKITYGGEHVIGWTVQGGYFRDKKGFLAINFAS